MNEVLPMQSHFAFTELILCKNLLIFVFMEKGIKVCNFITIWLAVIYKRTKLLMKLAVCNCNDKSFAMVHCYECNNLIGFPVMLLYIVQQFPIAYRTIPIFDCTC